MFYAGAVMSRSYLETHCVLGVIHLSDFHPSFLQLSYHLG